MKAFDSLQLCKLIPLIHRKKIPELFQVSCGFMPTCRLLENCTSSIFRISPLSPPSLIARNSSTGNSDESCWGSKFGMIDSNVPHVFVGTIWMYLWWNREILWVCGAYKTSFHRYSSTSVTCETSPQPEGGPYQLSYYCVMHLYEFTIGLF